MNNGGGDDLSGAYLFLPDGEAKDVCILIIYFIFINFIILNYLFKTIQTKRVNLMIPDFAACGELRAM